MFHKGPSKDRGSTKLAISNIILVANAFIWYLIAFNTLKSLLSQQNATSADTLMVLGSNTGAIAKVKVHIVKSIKTSTFFVLWISGGIILSLLPLVFNETVLH